VASAASTRITLGSESLQYFYELLEGNINFRRTMSGESWATDTLGEKWGLTPPFVFRASLPKQ